MHVSDIMTLPYLKETDIISDEEFNNMDTGKYYKRNKNHVQ